METQGKNSWLIVLGTFLGILTGFAVYAALFITGWSVLERATDTVEHLSSWVVWPAFFLILTTSIFGAVAAGKWARVRFTRTTNKLTNQIETRGWWRNVLGTCVGVFVGVVIVAVILKLAVFCLDSIGQHQHRCPDMPPLKYHVAVILFVAEIGILILSFPCALAFALFAGKYVRTRITGPVDESRPEIKPKPSVVYVVFIHATQLTLLWWLIAPFGGFPWGDAPEGIRELLSRWMRMHPILTILSASALLWGDVRVYLRLHRSGKRLAALIWLWGINCCLLALWLFGMWSIWAGIFETSAAAGL